MKRSGISRKTPLVAKAPLKPGSKKMNAVSKTNKRRREQAKGESMGALRKVIHVRCGGSCERCGRALGSSEDPWHAHHRKFRSRGGKDEVVNLVALCENCHHWAHNAALQSVPLGYSVLSTEDPAEIPVMLRGRKRVFLQPDGTYWAAAPLYLEEVE